MSIISADVLIKAVGGIQQKLPMYTPRYCIPAEYVTSVVDMIKCEQSETGVNWSSRGTVDHPSFTRLRNHLEAKGYIITSRNSVNGDSVIKEFYLNDVRFSKGDRFYSACAMKWYLERNNESR
jgi:hypothetical protein